MVRFRSLKEETPTQGKDILIRWKEPDGFYYYVVRYYVRENGFGYFEEAGGEQYVTWGLNEVVGWMYTSELNSL